MEILLVALIAVILGAALGWLLGSRPTAQARAERDARTEEFKRAITELAAAEERGKAAAYLRDQLDLIREERDSFRAENAALKAHSSAFEARLEEFKNSREAMTGHFNEVAGKLLGEAQKAFLTRAEERFKQSEETAGQNLKSMLQPVSDRLLKYEEAVSKVESERKGAFSELKGQIEQMRIGQEKVSTEAAKLVNSLRNAPKSRGRWGEQQLKNVLESCGLSEHADFQTEVSVAGEDGGRLRPDVIINIPGGQSLVIDAKVSLNAYQDAFGAADDAGKLVALGAHATAMRAHVNGLGNKAYWSQFADAPDYVIMFVPGEHFLSAALEHDPTLWDFAFDKRVLLATPTNLIAIARTVAAVWRQEKLAKEARQIGELGKEMHDRLAKVADDLRKVGSGLNSAVSNFNAFSNSFNGRLMVTGRKFKALNIETGARELEDVPAIETLARQSTAPILLEESKEAAE
ncbi:DNA recombination protein RmuC [Sphingomonas sp. PB4P5]|uniref:DNA recombination protein RmuC n=1 Tax=Parasphingomonas puruogangriensis TaxID=3096155 RepID=UPI002FCB97C8